MKNMLLFLVCFTMACSKPTRRIEYIEGLVNCHTLRANLKNPNKMTYEASQPTCMVGAQIPSFEAVTIDGKTIGESYFKGRVTVINFWFEACVPCVAEIPGFNELEKKYAGEKVNFLAIGRDSKEDVTDFLKKHPWGFDHVADGQKLAWDTFEIMWGFPTTFLVDKNAKIVMAFSGGYGDERAAREIQDKLIPMIDKALKKRA